MIKTLIFDLGNVLIWLKPREALKRFAETAPGTEMDDIAAFLGESDLSRMYETGVIDSRQYYRGVLNHFQADFSFERFCDIWQSIFLPNDELIALLPGLGRRVRLILLSNTNPLHADYIGQNYEIYPHFDGLIFSHETGLLKPDPAIYRLALKEAVCECDECLFIDDRQENVEGARQTGMRAHHFTGNRPLLELFNEFGVEYE